MALCGIGTQAGRNSFHGLKHQIFYCKLQVLWKALLSLPWTVGLDTLSLRWLSWGVQSCFTWRSTCYGPDPVLTPFPWVYHSGPVNTISVPVSGLVRVIKIRHGNVGTKDSNMLPTLKIPTTSLHRSTYFAGISTVRSLSSPTSGTPFVNFVFY